MFACWISHEINTHVLRILYMCIIILKENDTCKNECFTWAFCLKSMKWMNWIHGNSLAHPRTTHSMYHIEVHIHTDSATLAPSSHEQPTVAFSVHTVVLLPNRTYQILFVIPSNLFHQSRFMDTSPAPEGVSTKLVANICVVFTNH